MNAPLRVPTSTRTPLTPCSPQSRPDAEKRPARPGTITPDLAIAARHSYHGPLTS